MKQQFLDTLQKGNLVTIVFGNQFFNQNETGTVASCDQEAVTLYTEEGTCIIAIDMIQFAKILQQANAPVAIIPTPVVEVTALDLLANVVNFLKANGSTAFKNKVTGIADAMRNGLKSNTLSHKFHDLQRRLLNLAKQGDHDLSQVLLATLYFLADHHDKAITTLSQVQLPQPLATGLEEILSQFPEGYQNLCKVTVEAAKPTEPAIEADNDGEIFGIITSFNPNTGYGFMKEGKNDRFFHICQVDDQDLRLRQALHNDTWNGLEVSYLLGLNAHGEAATDLQLVSSEPVSQEYATGFISRFDRFENLGTIRSGNKSYTFYFDAIIDPYLSAYYDYSFNPQEQDVRFQIKTAKNGKKVAFNVCHASTHGTETNVPSYGNVDPKLLQQWLNNHATADQNEDPFAQYRFFPLPLASDHQGATVAPKQHLEAITPPAVTVAEVAFRGTAKEWMSYTKDQLTACERKLRHFFASVFSHVENYHYSDLQDDPTSVLKALKNCHPQLRFNEHLLMKNFEKLGKYDGNPNILNVLTMGFLTTAICENWDTKFKRYFRPANFDWRSALAKLTEVRDLLSHGNADKIDLATLKETCKICIDIVNM